MFKHYSNLCLITRGFSEQHLHKTSENKMGFMYKN